MSVPRLRTCAINYRFNNKYLFSWIRFTTPVYVVYSCLSQQYLYTSSAVFHLSAKQTCLFLHSFAGSNPRFSVFSKFPNSKFWIGSLRLYVTYFMSTSKVARQAHYQLNYTHQNTTTSTKSTSLYSFYLQRQWQRQDTLLTTSTTTPTPAIMPVTQIILENFKSYGGVQRIGPFKDFTCVIGPNGAGT